MGPQHLLADPRGEHLLHARVDPRVQRLALHHEAHQQRRLAQLATPQLRGAVGRLQLARVQQLQRAHHALGVVGLDPLRGP